MILIFALAVWALQVASVPIVDPSKACPVDSLKPGRYNRTIYHDGLVRPYILYVPSTYDATRPHPLFFVFHGVVATGDQAFVNFAVPDISEDHNVITITPTADNLAWNGGDCCAPSNRTGVDDVGFVRAMAAEASRLVCIDQRRIYAGGYSNGGYLSNRLACEASDLIRAIGTVAGPLSKESTIPCRPIRPVPVLHIHGNADEVVPYSHGVDGIQRWKTMNQCVGSPVVTFQNGTATCETYNSCAEGVETSLCTIDGGIHSWPGCSFYGAGVYGTDCGCEKPTPDLIATKMIWNFITRWALSLPHA
eukprot:TRINITY_DN11852_c0_g1_i1.p1 TRINITY_DN11852_c0_g1~~TRINITY_DN11852_c0_g1_i1.p1  ORF type:complete len:306 (+),score=44.26 TRINITY_DN11852_c0_g1_i1:52-969(+)